MSASRPPFRDMMNRARREAILEECTRLLSQRGFDAMTLDQVAEAAGMAKALLYKHFKGKEDLCCEAMARALDRVHAFMLNLPPQLEAVTRLQAVVRWIMQSQMDTEPGLVPERRSELRYALKVSEPYQEALDRVRDVLLEWIDLAQKAGQVHPSWPPCVVVHVVLSGVDNPITEALRQSGTHSQQQVVDCSTYSRMEMLRIPILCQAHGEPLA